MPTYTLRRFVRPEVLRAISPRSLLSLLQPHRKFFAAHGLDLPNGKAGPPSLDLDRLAQILASPDLHPPADLADALYYIDELATLEGMEALVPALGAGPSPFGLFGSVPADVAVRAWLADRSTVERKHAELFACRPRRFEYFQSYDDPPRALPDPTHEVLSPLESYLDTNFQNRGRGRGVRVMAFPHGDDCLFVVRHGDPRRREGALDGARETSVLYRPLKFDVVGYDARSGALRVFAQTKWETSLYRGAFGRFLFGDLGFFSGTGRYTLEPLRAGDPACLAWADVPPLKHVNLVEVHLRWGGIYNALEVHKATDVLAALRQRQTAFPEKPRIELAAFDVFLFGQQQPRRVTILPPNVARYSHEDESHLMDQWLAARGFIQGTRKATADGQQAADTLLRRR